MGALGLTGQLLHGDRVIPLRAGASSGRSAVAAVPWGLGRQPGWVEGRLRASRAGKLSRVAGGSQRHLTVSTLAPHHCLTRLLLVALPAALLAITSASSCGQRGCDPVLGSQEPGWSSGHCGAQTLLWARGGLTCTRRCVSGCVSTLRMSGTRPPACRLAAPRARALSFSSGAAAPSRGSSTSTVSQLKMLCTAEPPKALRPRGAERWGCLWPGLSLRAAPAPPSHTHLRNSSRSPDCAIETRVLVMDVPTLMPMMTGTDAWTVSTAGRQGT